MRREQDFPFYTLSDIQLTGLLADAEARGEPLEGQKAIIAVVKNRVASKRHEFYDSDILDAGYNLYYAVILKNMLINGNYIYQFSCFNEHDPNRARMIDMIKNHMYPLEDWAAEVISSEGPDPTDGSLFYYNPTVCTPSWNMSLLVETCIIGRHRFMKYM